MTDYGKPLPQLPSGAWGFVAARTDRPERLALYRADGSLNSSFAVGEDFADALAMVQRFDPAASWQFHGAVWAVFLPSQNKES